MALEYVLSSVGEKTGGTVALRYIGAASLKWCLAHATGQANF